MKRDNMPALVIGAAIVAGALIWAGVPLAGLALPLILLACPLMMVFMMRGMDHNGGPGGHEGHDSQQQQHPHPHPHETTTGTAGKDAS